MGGFIFCIFEVDIGFVFWLFLLCYILVVEEVKVLEFKEVELE